MRESEIERYFCLRVNGVGGRAIKFRAVGNRGVSDRIAMMPDGSTWFVEIKQPDGVLSALQEIFRAECCRLKQKYACLWSKEDVDKWLMQATK